MNLSSWRLPLLTFCSMLLLWEGVVVAFKVPDYLVPSPVQIAVLIPARFWDLLRAWLLTGGEALGGFLLSALAGIAVGLLFSISPLIRRCFYPYVVLLQTIPIIAVSPLILLWLGNGSLSVLFISFLISVPAVIVNTTQGLISIDTNLLNLFRMGSASVTTVLFKSALAARSAAHLRWFENRGRRLGRRRARGREPLPAAPPWGREAWVTAPCMR